ncbi:hypothetical protein PBS_44250 [Paraburkholderia sp. 2C]
MPSVLGAGWGIACETRTWAAEAGSDWVDGLMVVSIPFLCFALFDLFYRQYGCRLNVARMFSMASWMADEGYGR